MALPLAPLRPNLEQYGNEEVDVKQKSLFARLKKLFSTGVIVRNVGGKKLKIKDTGDLMYATDRNSLRDRFNRVRSTAYNAYTRDFALSYQAARIDLFRDYDCVGPDTIIPLPDGTRPTIKELTEKYKDKPQERFYVFSYDHETNSVKLGKAYHPRKKGGGTRMGYKITFDNGQYVIGSIKHPFLMRNGEYKMIFDLKVGDSVMPFKCIDDLFLIIQNLSFNHNIEDFSWDINKLPFPNITITSIECIGPLEVYDLTVEKYHNFATDSCFVRNTMDMDAILSAALSIYADECLTVNELGKMLTVHCDDENIKGILTNLFYDILNIEFNLWSWTRNMVKYGDFYLRLYISPEYGVYQVEPISAYNVERIENSDPLNKNYVKFQIRPTDTSQVETLEDFEMAHFRLLSDSNFIPYGRSMLEGARRTWKQLCLHQNSEIWTKNGYQLIKDIKPGAEIYSYNYEKCQIETTKVIDCIKTGDKDTLEIKTKHRVLHLTEDHELLIKNGDGNYLYKKAKDLIIDKKLGDNLVIPSINSPNDNFTIKLNSKLYYIKLNSVGIEFIKQKCNKIGIIGKIKSIEKNYPYKQIHAFLMGYKSIPYDVFEKIKKEFDITDEMYFLHIKNSKNPSFINKNLTFTLDNEFIRFFGFMLGDGWTSKNGIGFANGIYKDINERYSNTIKKYCESFYTAYPKNNNTHPGSVIIFSKELKCIMDCAGYITGFKNKRIPEWVFGLSKYSKREFIKGLFDADGSWKWGVIGLSNKEMITQLKHLCQQSGIMCNEVKCYKPVETVDEKGVHRFPTYKLYINFNYEYDLEFERVLSIDKYESNSPVYDIQVESNNHNFISNGVVIHNCLLEDAMLIHRVMRAPERRIFKIDIGNIPPNEVDPYMKKLEAQVKKVPYIDPTTGDYNLRFNLQPVRWDTKIPLLDGRTINIKELSDECKQGKNNYVYSIDKENNNSICAGKVSLCELTKQNSDLVRVTLDDDSYVDFEPNHPVMLRSGDYISAKDLKENDSLMPFYSSLLSQRKMKDYEAILDPNTEKYIFTHRMIANQFNIDNYNINKNCIHHIDFNKYNNNPENLNCKMSFKEHILYHKNNASVMWNSKTDEEKQKINQKRSLTHKFNFENGLEIPWSLGKTKDNNPIMLEISKKLSKSFTDERKKEYSNRMKNKKQPHHSEWMKNNYKPYIRTSEMRDKLSKAFLGENNPNYGKTWEEIHGIEKSNELKNNLSKRSTQIMLTNNPSKNDSVKEKLSKMMSVENKTRWQNQEYKNKVTKSMMDRFDDYLFNNLKQIVFNLNITNLNQLVKEMNNVDGLYDYYLKLNSGRKKPKNFIRITIQRAIERAGYLSVSDFIEKIKSSNASINHKVKKVEYLTEKDDVYCMNVEKYHNFAIDSHGGTNRNGFFVKNSMVEDFYLPMRGSDSGTSIETLAGMEFTGIDDVEYIRNKMMAALSIPKAFLSFEEELCVVPETKIPLLNGNEKTILELMDDYNKGIKNYVYSIDETTKNMVPGEIEWVGWTRKDAQLVRVWLDNNNYIDCTPDHLFMTRDGSWIEAQNLQENQSLMPLYRENKKMKKGREYESVYNPATDKWGWTHKMVDNKINGKIVGNGWKGERFDRSSLILVHHVDHNRFNNYPDNLKRMTLKEHIDYHSKCAEKTIFSEESIRKAHLTKQTKEYKEKARNIRLKQLRERPELKNVLRDYCLSLTFEERSLMSKKGWNNDERKKERIELNKKMNLSEKLKVGYKLKFPNGRPDLRGKNSVRYITPPNINDIISFIKNYNNKNEINKFTKLSKKMGYDYRVVRRSIVEAGYSVGEFMNFYIGYARGRSKKSLNGILNHKVLKIEWLTERKDTCDLRIKDYHNFATSAGVIIHNSGKSTLSQEDIRFCKTIQRIQKIITSELEKVAIVHLYSQGYRDENLVKFQLELTNPSTIFEKEKVELWNDKVDVAQKMMETKLFPKTWIYKNIFKTTTSEDETELQNQMVEDSKQLWRYKSIEEEGNDPAKPFQKINPKAEMGGGGGIGGGEFGGPPGGPSLGGPEIGGSTGGGGLPEIPLSEKIDKTEKGILEDDEIIKPLDEKHGEHADDYERPSQEGVKDARDYPFGEDPLGDKEKKRKSRPGRELRHIWKGGSPLSLESLQNSNMIKKLKTYLDSKSDEKKELIKETNGKSLLDESNILDQ